MKRKTLDAEDLNRIVCSAEGGVVFAVLIGIAYAITFGMVFFPSIQPDRAVSDALNHIAIGKSVVTDDVVSLIANSHLVSSLPLAAVLFGLFMSGGNRLQIVLGSGCVVLAGAISKAIQFLGPHRVRPLYDSALTLNWPSGITHGTLEHWSSFPSDTCAYLSAMAMLVFWHNRRLSIPAFGIVAAVAIARTALGLHFLSDCLVGAVIGAVVVVASQLFPVPKIRLKVQPCAFYAIVFVAAYLLATLFEEIRTIGRIVGVGLD
jgi:undecaprenyl-diphosphatase